MRVIAADATVLPRGWMMFDPALAEQIGINKAIIFQKINGWVEHNRRKDKNIRNGRAWSYNSIPKWGEAFQWLNANYVGKLIRELEEAGLLVSAKLGKKASDQTKHYSTAAGILSAPDPQQMSLWPVENMTLRGRKADDDSSIGTSTQKPSKRKRQTTPTLARTLAKLAGDGVAQFVGKKATFELSEGTAAAPEAAEARDEREKLSLPSKPVGTRASNTPPPIPRAPLPPEDISTDVDTDVGQDTEPMDVPEYVGIFTAPDDEIRGWLKTDSDRLRAWCVYAPTNGLGGGYVRQRMRDQSWPPSQKPSSQSWDNLSQAQRDEIEQQNAEAYALLMARREVVT